MASGAFYPASATDTALWRAGGEFSYSYENLSFGYSAPSYNSFVRVVLNVPQGAVISSASLTVYGERANTGTCPLKVHFALADNQLAPIDATSAEGMTLTDGVDWSPADFVLNTAYTTPDLTDILQEVVNRSGWVSGNHVVIAIKGTAANTNFRTCWNFTHGVPAAYPSLAVEWTSGIDLPSLSAFGVTGAVGSASIPSLSASSTLSWYSGDIELPALTMSGSGAEATVASGSMSLRIDNDGLGGIFCRSYSGCLGASEIPSVVATGVAKPGIDVALMIPELSMAATSGASGAMEVPGITSTGTTINYASGSPRLPVMDVYGFCYVGRLAAGAPRLPRLRSTGLALNGRVGRASMAISMRMSAHALAGLLADGGGRLRGMSATGAASIVSKGTGLMDFPPMGIDAVAVADSSEFSSAVAYDKEAIQ